jgi:ABC-type sugar transport system ATPase subunit
MESLLARRPHELSGGEVQRAALARAFALRPGLFLLDEPLANMDAVLRQELREVILNLQQRLGTTMLFVTHDQQEAMSLGGRMALLRDGAVEQIGAAMDIYHRPRNVFVASFLGSPPINLIPGSFRGGRFETAAAGIPLVSAALPPGFSADAAQGILGIRPEAVHLSAGEGGRTRIDADVVGRALMGSQTVLELSTPIGRLRALTRVGNQDVDSVWLDLGQAVWFDAATREVIPSMGSPGCRPAICL